MIYLTSHPAVSHLKHPAMLNMSSLGDQRGRKGLFPTVAPCLRDGMTLACARGKSLRTPRGCSFTVWCPDGQPLLLQSSKGSEGPGRASTEQILSSFFSRSSYVFSVTVCQGGNVRLGLWARSALSAIQKTKEYQESGQIHLTGSWPTCTRTNGFLLYKP